MGCDLVASGSESLCLFEDGGSAIVAALLVNSVKSSSAGEVLRESSGINKADALRDATAKSRKICPKLGLLLA